MEYPKYGNYMLDDPDCEETPYDEAGDRSSSFEDDDEIEDMGE